MDDAGEFEAPVCFVGEGEHTPLQCYSYQQEGQRGEMHLCTFLFSVALRKYTGEPYELVNAWVIPQFLRASVLEERCGNENESLGWLLL